MKGKAEHLIAKGERAQQADRPEAARKAFRKALRIRPRDTATLGRLAQLELRDNNPGGAIAPLRKLAALRPDDREIRLQLAEALEDSGDAAAAEEVVRALIGECPDFAAAHNGLGNLLQRRETFDEALESYLEALELSPGLAILHANAGNTLDALGRYADALACYDRAIELQPQSAAFHDFRGRAHTALDQPRRAMDDVERCLALDPADQKGLALQGVLFAALGRDAEARRLFDYERLVRPIRAAPPPGFATIEDFNAAAIVHIRARDDLEYDLFGASTRGGWHSGNLLTDPHPTMAALRTMLQGVFQHYISQLPENPGHPFLRQHYSNVRLVAQAQILESQGYLASHIHPGGWISSAYYLAVPEAVGEGEDKPGWLEFGRPTAEIKTRTVLETRCVRPEPGMAVLFPSYFFHGTRPFTSVQPRISLGCDLIPARRARANRPR